MTQRLTLPDRYTLARQPLIIHSDVPLPEQQRLFDDLAAQRADIAGRLALPAAEEPIHVYLFESPERFSGYMRLHHPRFPNRRAFFVETDTRLSIFAQCGEKVGEDLRHESTHAYLHAVSANIPLWLDEGLAKYYEPPRYERGLNRGLLERQLSEIAHDQWHGDLPRLERLDPTGDMNQDDYAQSWAWVHFLLESSPENAQLLCLYLGDLRRGGATEPMSVRLQRALGQPQVLLREHIRSLAAAVGR